MKTWTTVTALLAAGALVATAAYAQAPTTPKSKESPGAATGKSDSMKSDPTSAGAMKSEGTMKSGSGMAGGKREQVKAAQEALKDKGHDPGAADGVMGPKTQAALRDFQSKEGLKSTGKLDTETMAKLGVEAKAGASGMSRSPSASPPSGAGGTTSGSSGSSSTPSGSSSTPSGSSTK